MVISKTPLRISFFGGGTDMQQFWREEEGCVLSCSINKYIHVIVNKSFDRLIHIKYFEQEDVDSIDKIKHDLVRETMRKAGIKGGVEVVILSDIPHTGSGLGSSSTLTVGLLNAFYTYCGKKVSKEILAQQACEIEIDILGKPIGKQDQYIAAYGGLNKIVFKPNGSVQVQQVEPIYNMLPALRKYLLLFYTGIGHKSEDILEEQTRLITHTRPVLRKIKEQVNDALKILSGEDLEKLGTLMQEGWRLKCQLASKISNNFLNELIERAFKAGAMGAKITGAGGGGFLLLICKPELQDSVRNKLGDLKEFSFDLEAGGTEILMDSENLRFA
ncbi:GHMP kinase [Ruminiclostridium papyrosolvens DSM 2782]|uniref:GHMP kinase n=1 Tax=Ruminiclostridium papyrosolvens DSM 2782 TaxID=588581 RepID=F1TC98_9FIRM|nr:GHMP kinase [Ruminiclostridium papyrosolvens]EGD48013.1 GHMP kinase [Ruminiclostridium papyrosolvens DSM 2782]WES35097.1 GHMP kinase [Ruminiclostridium papyrosolvens DSM 2782]